MKKNNRLGFWILTALLAALLCVVMTGCKKDPAPVDINNQPAKTALTAQEIDELFYNYDSDASSCHIRTQDFRMSLEKDGSGNKNLEFGTYYDNIKTYGMTYYISGGEYYAIEYFLSSPPEYRRLNAIEYNERINDSFLVYNTISSLLLNKEEIQKKVEFYYGADEWHFSVEGVKILQNNNYTYEITVTMPFVDYDSAYDDVENVLYNYTCVYNYNTAKKLTEVNIVRCKSPICTGDGEVAPAKTTKFEYFYTSDRYTVYKEPVAAMISGEKESGEVTVYALYGQFPDGFDNTVASGSVLTLPAPEAIAGITFEGWYYDAQFKNKVKDNKFETGYNDTGVYAKWNTAKLTINAGDGEVPEIIKGYPRVNDYTGNYKARLGYTFEGMYYDAAFTQPIDDKVISVDTAIYIKWEKQFAVTYVADIDYILAKTYLDAGFATALPAQIYKKGMSLQGWYLNAERTVPVPDHYVPTGDISVYAKFETGYKITLSNANIPEAIVLSWIEFYVPAAKAGESFDNNMYYLLYSQFSGTIREGNAVSVFSGWYTDAALTQPFVKYPSANVTLYAKFSAPVVVAFKWPEEYGGGSFTQTVQAYRYSTNVISSADFFRNVVWGLEPPVRTEFDNLYTNAGLTTEYNINVWPEQSIDLYLGFKKLKKFYIETGTSVSAGFDYESVNGQDISSFTGVSWADFRALLNSAVSPIDSDYYVSKWYTDAAMEHEFTFSGNWPTEQTLLYPKLEKKVKLIICEGQDMKATVYQGFLFSHEIISGINSGRTFDEIVKECFELADDIYYSFAGYYSDTECTVPFTFPSGGLTTDTPIYIATHENIMLLAEAQNTFFNAPQNGEEAFYYNNLWRVADAMASGDFADADEFITTVILPCYTAGPGYRIDGYKFIDAELYLNTGGIITNITVTEWPSYADTAEYINGNYTVRTVLILIITVPDAGN